MTTRRGEARDDHDTHRRLCSNRRVGSSSESLRSFIHWDIASRLPPSREEGSGVQTGSEGTHRSCSWLRSRIWGRVRGCLDGWHCHGVCDIRVRDHSSRCGACHLRSDGHEPVQDSEESLPSANSEVASPSHAAMDRRISLGTRYWSNSFDVPCHHRELGRTPFVCGRLGRSLDGTGLRRRLLRSAGSPHTCQNEI